jgi:hypothetical protein
MSDSTPQTASYAEPGSAEAGPSGRRTAVIAAVTAGTLAVVGVGAFAAVQLLSGGAPAEEAIPAGAIAVVSLDLDPGAKQKVEAIKTLRKFPELKKQLGLDAGADLREKFFDEALNDDSCRKLSYESDIKPWIGDNVALAAVSFNKGKVSPVVALAVTDKDKATTGLDALIECTDSADQTGFAFNDDFVLVSDTQAHADQAVKDARAKPLVDDAAYQEWTGKVGDRGVANFYVAKAAAGYIADALGSFADPFGVEGDSASGSAPAFPSDLPTDAPSDLMSGIPSDFPTELLSGMPSDFASSAIPIPSQSMAGNAGASAPYARVADDPDDAIRKALAKFDGAAGALRFADGGAELEVSAGGIDQALVSEQGAGGLVTGLPDDTAAVFGLAVPKGWAGKLTDNLDSLDVFGAGSGLRGELENQLGISLPGDLETLLGEGFAFSLRGTPVGSLGSIQGPEDLPVGLTVKGDPAKIKAVIAKIEATSGQTLADNGVTVDSGDGKVTLSFDGDYAKSLQGGSPDGGDLGGNETFQKVVPEADRASAVVYVDFNSKWREAIAEDDPDPADFLANTAHLEALGMSSWSDGGTSHVLVKLTTD